MYLSLFCLTSVFLHHRQMNDDPLCQKSLTTEVIMEYLRVGFLSHGYIVNMH